MNTLFILLSLLSSSPIPVHPISSIDTGIQIHRHDGLLDEWPKEMFVTDMKSGIKYAIDNDSENMYVAMKISDPSEQLQLMHFGLRLLIDVKGKQKENKAIEFPLRNQMGSAIKPRGAKEQRMFYGINFIALRLIGFPGSEPIEQELSTPGSAQIGFSWDSTDIMYIEYLLPKSLLNLSGTGQQKISLGWKVFGPESIELLGPLVVPQGMQNTTSNPGSHANSLGPEAAEQLRAERQRDAEQRAEQQRAEQQRAARQRSINKTSGLNRGIREHKIWTNYFVSF